MADEALVLCYHALSLTWPAPLSTTPARFRRQMALLSSRGYRGATFTEAVTTPPQGRVVAVTFDDAYRSVSQLARPILDHFGLPATVFAPTDFVDAEEPLRWPGVDHWLAGPHERELLPLSWAELRALIDTGWEVGSHTGSHPRLTQLQDAALEDELSRSKVACERCLDARCTSIAYPYGDLDARVLKATAGAGYRAGAALTSGGSGPHETLAWPRTGIYHVDNELRFRLKISPAIRRLWGAVRSPSNAVARG